MSVRLAIEGRECRNHARRATRLQLLVGRLPVSDARIVTK
jgi:hypothetical protein